MRKYSPLQMSENAKVPTDFGDAPTVQGFRLGYIPEFFNGFLKIN